MTPEEAVSLRSYLDRIIGEIERRLALIERTADRLQTEQGKCVSRDYYDERHDELRRQIDSFERRKADAEAAGRLALRLSPLEEQYRILQHDEHKHNMSSQRLLLFVGAMSGGASALVALLVHYL